LLLLDAHYQIVFANDEAIRALQPGEQDRCSGCTNASAMQDFQNLIAGFAADNEVPDEFIYGGRAWHSIGLTLPDGAMPQMKVALVVAPQKELQPHATTFGAMYRLTPRETEAFGLFMKGLGVKQTAARMKISPSTAKAFLRMITIKMGVSGRAEMMAIVQSYMCPASLTCAFRQLAPVKPRSDPKD
jgi:DNA-binding CsgD family transcriptional regulator